MSLNCANENVEIMDGCKIYFVCLTGKNMKLSRSLLFNNFMNITRKYVNEL